MEIINRRLSESINHRLELEDTSMEESVAVSVGVLAEASEEVLVEVWVKTLII